MTTLEQYLREDLNRQIEDHVIRASIGETGLLQIVIYPIGKDGQVRNAYVHDNLIIHQNSIEYTDFDHEAAKA